MTRTRRRRGRTPARSDCPAKPGHQYAHNAYGEIEKLTDNTSFLTGDTFHNEVTNTGSVADASGLLYMNARYYNPSTVRFLSQGSYTGSASTPWTQHLYAYCNNNPYNSQIYYFEVGPNIPLYMERELVCNKTNKSDGLNLPSQWLC